MHTQNEWLDFSWTELSNSDFLMGKFNSVLNHFLKTINYIQWNWASPYKFNWNVKWYSILYGISFWHEGVTFYWMPKISSNEKCHSQTKNTIAQIKIIIYLFSTLYSKQYSYVLVMLWYQNINEMVWKIYTIFSVQKIRII